MKLKTVPELFFKYTFRWHEKIYISMELNVPKMIASDLCPDFYDDLPIRRLVCLDAKKLEEMAMLGGVIITKKNCTACIKPKGI